MRLLVYALGGGLGHLQRSLALCRSASRRGHESVILCNCPTWPRIDGRIQLPGVRVHNLTGDDDGVLCEATRCVQSSDADVLIVDTLPRGIAGELADTPPDMPTVLVHRDLTAHYANRPEVLTAVQRFDLMLCPGERGPFDHRNVVETPPWIMFDAEELLKRDEARNQLGGSANQPVVVVCDATDAHEATGLATVADRLRSRWGDRARVHTAQLEHTWPLLRLHLGIDLLVGSAGYNTVHEARLTQTRLRAIPRERLYDRQQRRLHPSERLEDLDIDLPPLRRQNAATYQNGSHAAVKAIEQLVTIRCGRNY